MTVGGGSHVFRGGGVWGSAWTSEIYDFQGFIQASMGAKPHLVKTKQITPSRHIQEYAPVSRVGVIVSTPTMIISSQTTINIFFHKFKDKHIKN